MASLHDVDAASLGVEALLEAVPDGIAVVAADGEILYANQALLSLSGYSRSELRELRVDDLVPPDRRQLHAEHRRGYVRRPARRRMGARSVAIELRAKDGASIPVDIALNPVRLGTRRAVVAAVRDDRDRHRHERDLQLHAQLLELAHDAILVRDAVDDTITYWSDGATDTYGYPRAEAVGRTKSELLRPSYPGSPTEEPEAVLRRVGRWEGEVEHSHRDGRRLTVSSRRVLGPGREPGARSILEINRDVTAEKRLHGELAILEDRQRLGREIHDLAIRTIFGVGLELQALATTLDDGRAERVDRSIGRLDDVVRELRDHIFSPPRDGGRRMPG